MASYIDPDELREHYNSDHGFTMAGNTVKLLLSQTLEAPGLRISRGSVPSKQEAQTSSGSHGAVQEVLPIRLQDLKSGEQWPMYGGADFGEFHGS